MNHLALINQESLEKVKSIVGELPEKYVLVCLDGDTVISPGSEKPQLLTFTATLDSIFFVDPKSRKPNQTFYWFQIQMIKSRKGSIIFSTQNQAQTIKFETEIDRQILLVLIPKIWEILSDSEVPQLDIEYFDYKPYTKRSIYAPISRIHAKCRINRQTHLNEAVLKRFQQYLYEGYSEIDLSTISEDPNERAILLDSLLLAPHITSIDSHVSSWTAITSFLQNNVYITKFITTDELTTDAFQIPVAFSRNKECKIQYWGIQFASITPKTLKFISTQLQTLDLSYSLRGEGLDQFLQLMSTDSNLSRISSLKLNGIKGLDVERLLMGSRSLDSLSIAFCCLQVSTIFNALVHPDIPTLKLSSIDISGNRGTEGINDTVTLPPSISEIIAENIIYSGDNLLRLINISLGSKQKERKAFFEKIDRSSPPKSSPFKSRSEYLEDQPIKSRKMKLDASYSIMDKQLWQCCLPSFDELNPENLTEFIWRDNPIDSNLLDFLDKASNLQSIDFSGSIRSEEDCLDLVNFIADNPNISTIVVRGTFNCHFRKSNSYIIRYQWKLFKFT